MKILWVCGAQVLGGAERAMLQIAELLRERGHAVQALCRWGSAVVPALAASSLPVRPAPLGGPLNFRALCAIAQTFAHVAPDIALVTTSDEWVWSSLAPRQSQTRLVFVRHMALPLPAPVRWLATHRADAIVAVSRAVRDALVGTGFPGDLVRVIYNPVRFPPRADVPTTAERARARATLGLEVTGRWVGFLGGTSARKGVRDVFAAVAQANDKIGSTNLLVCGHRPRGGCSISGLSREYGLEGKVRDLGEIDDVTTVLTAADAVVVATHRELAEGLSLAAIESMACGTPVIGYATGGIPEAIGADGEAGRLARADDVRDLGRALVEVLVDLSMARQLAANGFTRVRQLFDPQWAVEAYERLFVTLCSKENGPVGRVARE